MKTIIFILTTNDIILYRAIDEENIATESMDGDNVCERLGLYGWKYWKQSCYYFKEKKLTWIAAKERCEALSESAHLVVMNTQEEYDFVKNYSASSSFWFGCTDIEHEGTWICFGETEQKYFQEAPSSSVGYWGKIMYTI